MKTTNLKPCPFCGKEARLRYLGDKLRGDKYMARCTDTSCPGRIFRTYPSEIAAEMAWNRRATDENAGRD